MLLYTIESEEEYYRMRAQAFNAGRKLRMAHKDADYEDADYDEDADYITELYRTFPAFDTYSLTERIGLEHAYQEGYYES